MPSRTDTGSDEEYALRLQKGDQEAFGVLVDRYEPKLLRYGRKFLSGREDVEDAVQEVFLNTYQNIRSFDPAQRFSPWIYRIAHNEFVNRLRSNSRNPLVAFDFDALFAYPVYDDAAEKEREQKELREMIDKGLDRLPPKHREVLVLYYLEELQYKEIAEILRIPMGTAAARLKRAREALKRVYESMDIKYGT